MSGTLPTLLEYASPAAARQPWGPVFFPPSLRSLVLLCLTAAAVAWLSLRHNPWRHIDTIPADIAVRPLFTRDSQLLTFDTLAGVRLYDPATAQVVRTVLPTIDTNTYRYFVLGGGQQILALPFVDRVALLYDVSSGRIVERLPNPDGLGSFLVAIAPDAPRIITSWTGGNRKPKTDGLLAWDLRSITAARPDPLALGNSLRAGTGEFSPDGKRLLVLDSYGADLGFELFDGMTFAPLKRQYGTVFQTGSAGRFISATQFWLIRREFSGSPTRLILDLRSADTGELIRSTSLTSAAATADVSGTVVSPDARRAALKQYGVSGADTLTIIDLDRGQSVLYPAEPLTRPITFFPDSRRLLVLNDSLKSFEIIAPSHTQPLAIVPAATTGLGEAPEIAPDGQTIVTSADARNAFLDLYRPTGQDCPESPLGALAFPQTWLTSFLFAALVFSLTRDARPLERTLVARPAVRLLTAAMRAIALILTLHALLAACLGHRILTPAPLLLIAAIGLATHARFWRWTTVILLAANLPLCLYLMRHLQQLGLAGSTRYLLLDRHYAIPHALPFAALAAAAILIIAALPTLHTHKAG